MLENKFVMLIKSVALCNMGHNGAFVLHGVSGGESEALSQFSPSTFSSRGIELRQQACDASSWPVETSYWLDRTLLMFPHMCCLSGKRGRKGQEERRGEER